MKEFGRTAFDYWEPICTDLGAVALARSPKEVIGGGCFRMNIAAGEDRFVSMNQTEKIAYKWDADNIVLPGFSHNFSDKGWELALIKNLGEYLDKQIVQID